MLPLISAIAEGHQKGVVLQPSFISPHSSLHPVDYPNQMETQQEVQ